MSSSTLAFVPSLAQRRLLDYIHENPGYQSTRDLCRAANVPRATYYRWCQSPAFRQWFGAAWIARLAFDGVALLNMARAQAPEKYSYWKALSDLIFDPKGIGALAKWSATLAPLAPDAFLPAPVSRRSRETPGAARSAQPGPVSPWLSEEEWNQRIVAGGETLHAPAPSTPAPPDDLLCGQTDRLTDRPALNPVHTVKLLSRALGRIRASLAGPKSRGLLRAA